MKAKISRGEELYNIFADILPQFAAFVGGYRYIPSKDKDAIILNHKTDDKNPGKAIFIFTYIDGTSWRFETAKYLAKDREEMEKSERSS